MTNTLLACARCGTPIRSGQSTRFIRSGDRSTPRIEHITCPTGPEDRTRLPVGTESERRHGQR
jgi:hypothetical protein